ncbi:amino acid permease-domain-containing protein [Hyaloscypha finlandica]|nr:amino acid permease-domain-containing protein [Hyaloscypha finlandica]
MQDPPRIRDFAHQPDADDIDWLRGDDETPNGLDSRGAPIELVTIAKSPEESSGESTSVHDGSRQEPRTGEQIPPGVPSLAPIIDQDEPGFDERRKVNRVLEWYHIFFISLSGTLGVGLYVQGGSILRLGGPYVLLSSFLGLGILAWAVMQGVAEMLCLWPISGALTEFVKSFVDEDLGTAVGLAYWFSYTAGFAAVTMTLADEVAFWSADPYLKAFLLLSGIPISMVGLNTLGVQVYAWIEFIGGTAKLLFIFGIIISTLGTIIERSKNGESVTSRWHGSHFDASATKTQAFAFFMSFRIAAFAFVGIEITAATALEAKASTRQVAHGVPEEDQAMPVETKRVVPITRLKRPATKIPIVVGCVYILAAFMIALGVDSTDPCLPAQPWTLPTATPVATCSSTKSNSAFVFAAQSVNWKHFPDVITAFIVFTAFSAANTQLYVGSRTLFSLARTSHSAWGKLGRTTRTRLVPLSAVLATSILIPFPFLSYLSKSPKEVIFDVLNTTSSLLCVIVWLCECIAFIRFFYCMKRHQVKLNDEPISTFDPPFDRFFRGTRKYPWVSHGQSSHPFMTFFALGGCLFILIIANFACLWSGFDWRPFLSSFLAPILFVLVFFYLKLRRGLPYKDWTWLVPLDHYTRDLVPILRRLQDIREKSILAESEERAPVAQDPDVEALPWWRRKLNDLF